MSMGVDVKVNTRAAAHLSSLSTPFFLMQLAMMMAEVTPSSLSERSIFSVRFVPLSSSIGSALPSTLPRETRQVKTVHGSEANSSLGEA